MRQALLRGPERSVAQSLDGPRVNTGVDAELQRLAASLEPLVANPSDTTRKRFNWLAETLTALAERLR
ncbi:MAG: hypothetical protein OEQ25_00330 [Gammaproteobacteria bacterium]|nr:hypothetical protein [Gammaproteobacteria bacterium]MDH3505558.1 hypothetical protein [Gammaproteobacteria bacterium]